MAMVSTVSVSVMVDLSVLDWATGSHMTLDVFWRFWVRLVFEQVD